MSPVHIEQVSKRFRNVTALNRVDLQVPEGAMLALIGPSGAGKTTLLQIVLNIQRPSNGRAEILAKDSRSLGAREFQRIGYVSENQDLIEWMKVRQFLEYCREFYPDWSDAEASALMRQLDLPPDRKLAALSRGMKIKAALASSLAYKPEVLILDEPFSGLDPSVREQLAEAILERADQMTTVIASHDLADLESFASHIAYLDRGAIRFAEELSSLTNRFREIEVVLEEPTIRSKEWPAQWLHVEVANMVARFTDSQYAADATEAEIRRRFARIRQVNVRSLDLRSIFIALASGTREN